MGNNSEEETPDWNRFWSHNPTPDDIHEFGECMEGSRLRVAEVTGSAC